MTSMIYGEFRIAPVKSSPDKRPQLRRSFFVRLMDSVAESRQRAAMIEIVKHAHLLSPAWFEQEDGASSRVRGD
jgi:hypothetical protein